MSDPLVDRVQPAEEAASGEPEGGAGSTTRRIDVRGTQRTVRLDDVDDVIGIAAELKNEVSEQLTIADLEQVAAELDIEPRYVQRAVARLEQRRRRAAEVEKVRRERRRRLLRRTLTTVAAIVAVLILVPLWTQSGLRGDLGEVERQKAQVRNVIERQEAVARQWNEAPPSPDRDAELSGAENRVRIERARYDEAAARYNTQAGGPLGRLTATLFGLPARVPLSNEMEGW